MPPTISIIIRTFNEERHLGNLLRAITEQDYKDWEIIVVDSGSSDKTLDIARQYPTRIVQINSRDFTFGYSLNVGCKEAKGEILVIASAHVLPTGIQWLGSMVAPFKDPKVGMVYGRQMGAPTSKFSEQRDFARLFGASSYNSSIFLDYANNANAAIRRALWEERPFDEYLFGLEDIDWARHATAQGHLVHYEPAAAVCHIHEESWAQVFNRYRREAIAAARLGLAHPPQSRVSAWWLASSFALDFFSSFPNWLPKRLEEIARFRYYQWKGSRQGWFHDSHLDVDRDKFRLFYPAANRSVVIDGKEHAALKDLPIPELKPGDVLIKVSHVGICRTDLEVYEGTLGYYRDGVARYPIVPGHEFSGTIVAIGASGKYRRRFSVGQRVVGECILSRGDMRSEVGVINHDGAYANFAILPGDFIHKIPDHLPLQTAALAEPLAVVLRALERVKGRVPQGAPVGVVGAGPIGNLAAQVLAGRGYSVTIFDKNKQRLGLLAGKAQTSTALENLGGYALIVEATGAKDALEKVLKESSADNTILLLGFPYGEMAYNFEDVVGHEKAVIGSVGAGWDDFREAINLLPELDTAAFTQTVMPLSEFKKAWDMHRSGEHFKILLTP